jgi:hypothetical protein
MTESEWLISSEPDLMLEVLVGKIDRATMVEFVRQCWARISRYVDEAPQDRTVVDQFSAIAGELNDMDAATYAAEAALKAAGWAPDLHEEQTHQADLLRRLVGNPFRADAVR